MSTPDKKKSTQTGGLISKEVFQSWVESGKTINEFIAAKIRATKQAEQIHREEKEWIVHEITARNYKRLGIYLCGRSGYFCFSFFLAL